MSNKEMIGENVAAAVAKGSMYGGAAAAVTFGGLSISEWAAVGGFLVAVVGLAVQWRYTRLKNMREQAAFELTMQQVKRKDNQDEQ